MAVNATIFVTSAAWNAVTYNSGTGGTIRADYSHSTTAIEDRTGDDFYAPRVMLTDASVTVRITLRDFCWDLDPTACTTSNLVITLTDGCGNNVVCTFADMLLEDISGTADRGQLSEAVLTFRHVSDNGSTNPMTAA